MARLKDAQPWQRDFTPVLVDFLEHAYIETLEENGDAKIRYLSESFEGAETHIETRVTLKDGNSYTVAHKFHLDPAGWRVYDVVVEQISLVDNTVLSSIGSSARNPSTLCCKTCAIKRTRLISPSRQTLRYPVKSFARNSLGRFLHS